jgi:hypothetical protein
MALRKNVIQESMRFLKKSILTEQVSQKGNDLYISVYNDHMGVSKVENSAGMFRFRINGEFIRLDQNQMNALRKFIS